MKKLFTLFFLFAFVLTTNAAVQLRENFESGSLSSGWTTYSSVTATQAWRIAESVSNGVNGSPKSISAYEWSSGTHYFAGIPYLAGGKNYNEWLVTPEISIPTTQNRNIITFYSHHQDLQTSMTLRVFEGSDTANAVVIWTANAVNKWDSLIEVNISRFNGKKVHFAWVLQRNVSDNLDNSAWGIDIVTVETVINGVDLEPFQFLSPLAHEDINMYKAGVNIPVSVKVTNNGRTDATGCTISYTFEGNTVTENLATIAAKAEITHNFATPINVSAANNNNTISVTVNASGDEVSTNNTISIPSFWTCGDSSLDFNFESSTNLISGNWEGDGWVIYQEDKATGYRIPSQSQLFNNSCWAVGKAGGTLSQQNWGMFLAFVCSDFQENERIYAADRWMILPQMHISSAPTFLKWDAASANSVTGSATEDYEVLISTTNNAVSSFTKVHSIMKEKYVNPNKNTDKPSTRYIDLSSYAGKDIYIAFRCVTSEDRGMLLIDNISFIGQNVYGTDVKQIEKIKTIVYPNPANDYVKIESEYTILGVEVYNTLGQKVYTDQQIQNNFVELTTQSLENGMYLISIRTSNGTAVEKVNIVR